MGPQTPFRKAAQFDACVEEPQLVNIPLFLRDFSSAGLDYAQSAHAALDIPPAAVRNRALLLGIMAAAGWQHIDSEWWHYQLPDAGALPLLWAWDVPDGPM